METTIFSTDITDLPNELFSIIVGGNVKVHYGLALACKRFFSVLTPISYSMWVDYAIFAGHRVEITKNIIQWYVKGKLHRMDGPAVEWLNGNKEWWVNGERHRVDGPAIECMDGKKSWWVNGKLHRINGPAIVWSSGTKSWYVNGDFQWIDFKNF